MPRSVVISSVAMGTLASGVCLWCHGHETSFEVVALLSSGVLTIGDITLCETCGGFWHCRFCPARFPADGVRAHRHILAEHSV